MNLDANVRYQRGTCQPESAEEKRKRLHREAARDVKAYAAALREAKERYRAYDTPTYSEPGIPQSIEEPALAGDERSQPDETPA